MDNLKEKTISALFWKLLERFGSQVVALIVQIVMARILAPEDFGALAILLVFINIGNIVVQSGLNTALVQTKEIEESDYSTVFWMSFIISLVLYLVFFLAAPVFADFYENPGLVDPLRVLTIVLVINSFAAVLVAMVQRDLKFKMIFKATLLSAVGSGLIGIWLALVGFGIWALVVQQVVYQIINCAVLSIQLKWLPKLVFNARRAKMLFRFGWKLLASGLLSTAYDSLADLIIGKQFGTRTLGFVSQGDKYPRAIGSMLDGAIQPVMLAATSRVQEDVATVKSLVRRALKTSTYFIFPAMALFAAAAEPTIRLLLGEKWLAAVPFLQIYCFIYALLPVHTTNLQALNGMGRSDIFLKLEIIKKAYGVVMILIAAFVFQNVYAIVLGYVITGIISTFVNAYPNKKVIDYSYGEQLRDMGPAFFLSLACMVIAWPITMLAIPDIAMIILQVVVFSGVYIALSKLCRLEEASYLVVTLKEMLAKKQA